MDLRHVAVAGRVRLALLVAAVGLAGDGAGARPAAGALDTAPPLARIRWLVEPGSETFAHGAFAPTAGPIVVAVPEIGRAHV